MAKNNDIIADTSLTSIMDTCSISSPETRSLGNEVAATTAATQIHLLTPTSILIEALVQHLCIMYDREKASKLYSIVCEHLFKMQLIDESYRMREFESVRMEYQRAFHMLLKSTAGSESDEQPITSGVTNTAVYQQQTRCNTPSAALQPIWSINDNSSSRYFREFDELQYIAGGGFGKVYKVRHKLDGTEYAVKKIPIHYEGLESVRHYLSEVKTFATINHSNVVQYNGAWMELVAPMLTTKNTCSLKKHDSHTNEAIVKKPTSDDDQNWSMGNMLKSIMQAKKQLSSSDFEVEFVNSGSNQQRDEVEEDTVQSYTEIKAVDAKQPARTSLKWAILYIQMELCQSTLKDWLERRNTLLRPRDVSNTKQMLPLNSSEVRTKQCLQILVQLLHGLEYIQSKGVVHHDIKPSNIFIKEEANGRVLFQLGDFGLACPLQSVRHTLAFGTRLYSAPEQLDGNCDPKSDMYSLGIVLYELIQEFSTDMERVQSITEVRNGHLPDSIRRYYPQVTNIISELLNPLPKNRPDASHLLRTLETNSMHQIHAQIDRLRYELAEKDEEINRLRVLLQLAGRQQ